MLRAYRNTVNIVVAWRMDEGYTEDWIVGVFYSRDRAEECVRMLRKDKACDGARVHEEVVVDDAIGVA